MKINKDVLATLGGLLTSLFTALAVIDFETFDFKKPSDLMKLMVVAMPAIGGYFSKLKSKDENIG